MSFRIKQSDTFKWPVKVPIPRDGGGFEVGSFDAEFKRLPRSKSEKLAEQVLSGEITGLDAVRSILVGWAGVYDGDGNAEIPFSETNREALLEISGVAVALFRVFMEANNGAAEAKN